MAKPTSAYGFAYIFHMPRAAFNDLVGHFTGLEITVTEERENVQVAHFADYKTKMVEAAACMFELWTGQVHKCRYTNSQDIEIVLAMDDLLKDVDHASAFGALRFTVRNQIHWKREQCERLYQECFNHGFQLPQIPNSACAIWKGVETPNLMGLLLDEVTDYLDKARSKKSALIDRNQNETVRDLGRMLRVRRPIAHRHTAQ